MSDLTMYEGWEVFGRGIQIEVVAALPPHLLTAFGGRRWLDEWVPPPRNRQVITRLRNTLMDAVLVTLRSICEVCANSIIGHGEGAIFVMATLSAEIRKLAYTDRRVLGHEAEKLEECATSLCHALLIAPHVYPVRSYMPFLREYMPEIICILPGETQVIAVIPERDSSSILAKETAQAVMGIIFEHVRVPGPSYRTIPRSPLPLHQLAPEIKLKYHW